MGCGRKYLRNTQTRPTIELTINILMVQMQTLVKSVLVQNIGLMMQSKLLVIPLRFPDVALRITEREHVSGLALGHAIMIYTIRIEDNRYYFSLG